jgi:Carboxypeptidase regulatory-like domain
VKRGPLLCFWVLLASAVGVCGLTSPAAAQAPAKPSLGTLSGVVRDGSGTPQLGATVEVLSEAPGIAAAQQFLTNTQGFFRGEKLVPGFYTVRVTLAGYLPSLEKHVRISSNLTTVVRIELESMFASIEQLRRPPANGAVEQDDWKWTLRSSAGLRPVLQWNDDDTPPSYGVVLEQAAASLPRARIDFTDGARRPGSPSSVGAAPGTAFAYDQRIDKFNHIIFAGQVSYDEDSPAGGIATVWLPTGSAETGPESTIVLREAKLGPNGPTFRGVRLDQGGTFALGNRFILHVGGEYVLVGAGASAWSLRPRMKLESKLSPNWYLDIVYASSPAGTAPNDAFTSELTGVPVPNALTSALNQLDAFPALMWRNGRPVLENGRHEEIAVERKVGSRGFMQVAGFHDDNSHVALFGRGAYLPSSEYLPDFDTKGFAYDGGHSSAWGGRVALRERISDDLEFTTIYAFSGALAPTNVLDGALREAMRTESLQSLGANVNARVPRTRTRFNAGYKWISGSALSRVDAYGENMYQMNPYLHVGIRQPLPHFAMGQWEANAECDNLLAQGYVTMNTGDGQILLMPAARSFRGGLSLQF